MTNSVFSGVVAFPTTPVQTDSDLYGSTATNATLLANIVDPEVLADQASAKFPDKLVIGSSNLVSVNKEFPLGSPGSTFTIPAWNRIGSFADKAETAALVPGKVTTHKEQAVVVRGGAAYAVNDVAALVSIPDPASEIASQIARRAAEYVDAKLLAKLNVTPNTYDATDGTIDPDDLITGMTTTLGDNYGALVSTGVIIMHSKVFGDLMKLDVIQNVYQSGMDVLRSGNIPMLLGMPIYVSDLVTTSAASSDTPAYYNTYVVGPGSLGLFYQRQLRVEFDRDILLGEDIIAATVHFAAHLYGYDDVTTAVVAEQNKSIPVVLVQSR